HHFFLSDHRIYTILWTQPIGKTYGLEKETLHSNFILTPIPKCGTHLLMRCINLMTNKGIVGLVGGTTEEFIKSLKIAKQKNAILKCHHYSGNFASSLYKLGYKNIFQCRDPRDACVSFVFYMDKWKNGEKTRDFFTVPDDWDSLTFDEKLYAVIVGKNCKSYLKNWYSRLLPWSEYPRTLIVKFEDLIGSQGGGNDDVQLQTIMDIASFTNMDISEDEITQVAIELYRTSGVQKEYNGMLFTPGQIGNWKIFFNDENKRAFKKSYNHLLTQFGYEQNAEW
ncbi:MAG: sulfotransferase domain-containing protein, partial [Waddliaceae bacterium]